eukprot:8956895-Pyramimonas_sp.AAC.1
MLAAFAGRWAESLSAGVARGLADRAQTHASRAQRRATPLFTGAPLAMRAARRSQRQFRKCRRGGPGNTTGRCLLQAPPDTESLRVRPGKTANPAPVALGLA